ncbi:rhomboid family intramembrane serine protease [Planctomycetes bacterium K23_9]|uniref:Rhomboid protease GlpG n=1 Tax=Stieleria marina TaxID=1930275 RepID=A0A517P1A0_9BACT|nr:Rhomboid protease GlpG [Planctomycetes bacterium K23_9]
MRRIGTLTDGSQAKRFCDFMVTQSIDATSEKGIADSGSSPASTRSAASDTAPDSTWDIWIREEAHVAAAREALQAFQANPNDSRFNVAGKADEIRHQKVADQQRKLKQQKAMVQKMPRSSGAAVGGGLLSRDVKQQKIPVTIAIIAISVLCSFATGFGRPRKSRVPGEYSTEENLYGALSFVDWRDYHHSKNDAFASIRKGEVWRLITPMFMHGATMHLVFNMMFVFFLGSVIERLHGSLFLAILVIVTHVIGMIVQVSLPGADALPDVLSGLAGSPFAIGASGAVYGLFGYLWIRPALDRSYPIQLDDMNVIIMLVWLVACIFVINGVANGAHIGGFISGILAAVLVVQVSKLSAK